MSDSISRQAAIDAVNEYLRLSEVSKTVQNMTSIQGVLRRLPSAQPEIIFCKDCKYWEQEGICEGYCHETEIGGIDEDHFCSYAERRTDGF